MVPFLYAFNPALIGIGSFLPVAWATLVTIIDVTALAGGTIGNLLKSTTVPERILLVCGGLLLLYVGLVTDIIGLLLIAIALTTQLRRNAGAPVTNTKTL